MGRLGDAPAPGSPPAAAEDRQRLAEVTKRVAVPGRASRPVGPGPCSQAGAPGGPGLSAVEPRSPSSLSAGASPAREAPLRSGAGLRHRLSSRGPPSASCPCAAGRVGRAGLRVSTGPSSLRPSRTGANLALSSRRRKREAYQQPAQQMRELSRGQDEEDGSRHEDQRSDGHEYPDHTGQ